MTASRDDVVAYARTLAGLGADPADPDRRAAYLDLIAGGETPAHAAEMATMSGCELVQRGILRRFIRHARLDQPYVPGHAGEDLITIAHDAAAARAWSRPCPDPQPGDIVLIGGGPDGGGPEHAYMVLDLTPDPYTDGTLLVTGLDGGQRDPGGRQLVTTRDHALDATTDHALSANDPGGGTRRRVRWVLDLGKILDRFGAA